jgi:hypothetical protein
VFAADGQDLVQAEAFFDHGLDRKLYLNVAAAAP